MHARAAARAPSLFCALLAAAAPCPSRGLAQHHHHPAPSEKPAEDDADDAAEAGDAGLALPHARNGSGTGWQADSTPVEGFHFMPGGGWMLMLHYAASAGWDAQLGPRGDRHVVSTNWAMLMAQHPLGGGDLLLRTMLTLEPLTVEGRGFPELLQSGEFYDSVHLHDHQHPHNFFMEVSATWRHALTSGLSLELYLAPSGEPALGPTAFMHRASAQNDPFPPIGHHWQDSTHVSFGVATAGLYTRALKVEASWFNGREPDQYRWRFELDRMLDAFAVRVSANPLEALSFQLSYGYLPSPEQSPPGISLPTSRVTASATTSVPVFRQGRLDATAVWGRNLEVTPLDSFLVEANLDLDGANAPFLRLEYVDKTAHDLVVPGVPTYVAYALWNAAAGFAHRFPALGPVVPSLGVRINAGLVPSEIASLYGGRAVAGGFVYLLLRPPRMDH